MADLCSSSSFTSIHYMKKTFSSVQFSSVAQSCPTLCDPMNCSTPGLPVHHRLPELPKSMSTESLMPSNHLILCHPLLHLPSIFPSNRVCFIKKKKKKKKLFLEAPIQNYPSESSFTTTSSCFMWALNIWRDWWKGCFLETSGKKDKSKSQKL